MGLGGECSSPLIRALSGHILSLWQRSWHWEALGKALLNPVELRSHFPQLHLTPKHCTSFQVTRERLTTTLLVTCRKVISRVEVKLVSLTFLPTTKKKISIAATASRPLPNWASVCIQNQLRPHSRTTQQHCTQSYYPHLWPLLPPFPLSSALPQLPSHWPLFS